MGNKLKNMGAYQYTRTGQFYVIKTSRNNASPKWIKPDWLWVIQWFYFLLQSFRIFKYPVIVPRLTGTVSDFNCSNQQSSRQIARLKMHFPEIIWITRRQAGINIDPFPDICRSASIFYLLLTTKNLFSIRLPNA